MDGLYKADLNAILLTASFEVTAANLTSNEDLNTTKPESQLLKHIVAVQNTSVLAKSEAKNFNAANGQKFADSKRDDDGGDCQVCFDARRSFAVILKSCRPL